MQMIRTRKGVPLSDEAFHQLDLNKSPEICTIYSAVLSRLEREREKSGENL